MSSSSASPNTCPPPIQTFPPPMMDTASPPINSPPVPPSPPAVLPSPPPQETYANGDQPDGSAAAAAGRSKSSAMQKLHDAFQALSATATTQSSDHSNDDNPSPPPRRSTLPPPQKRPLSAYSIAASSLLIKQRKNQFITTTPTNSSPNNSGDEESKTRTGNSSIVTASSSSEPSSRTQSPEIGIVDRPPPPPSLPSLVRPTRLLNRSITPTELQSNSLLSAVQNKRIVNLNRAKTLGARPNVRIAGVETRVEMSKTPPVVASKRASIFRRFGGGNSGGASSSSAAAATHSSAYASLLANSGTYNSDEDHYSHPSFGIRQGKKLFTVYKINVKTASQTYTVYRRYSEFEQMDKSLQKLFAYLHKQLPEFPPKRLLGDNMDPQFLEQRAKALHAYIQQIFSSPVLMRSQPVREFLCKPDTLNSKDSPLVGKPLVAIESEESSDINDDDDSRASTRSESSSSFAKGS